MARSEETRETYDDTIPPTVRVADNRRRYSGQGEQLEFLIDSILSHALQHSCTSKSTSQFFRTVSVTGLPRHAKHSLKDSQNSL
jgi:hypothetical protein